MKFLLYSTTPSLTVEKAGDNGFRLRQHVTSTASGYVYWWDVYNIAKKYFYGSEFAEAIASIQTEDEDFATRQIRFVFPGTTPSEDYFNGSFTLYAMKLDNAFTDIQPAILVNKEEEVITFASQYYVPLTFRIGSPRSSPSIMGLKDSYRDLTNALCVFESPSYSSAHFRKDS